MSQLDQLLAAAADFAANFDQHVDVDTLSISPRKGVVIITCVDPRVDPLRTFGLEVGDAIVVRVPGARVSREMLDDLQTASAVGRRKPDIKRPTTDILVVAHSRCGIQGIADPDVRAEICKEIGGDAERMDALAITTFEESLAKDVQEIRDDERFAGITVTGWLYDVDTGLVTSVVPA